MKGKYNYKKSLHTTADIILVFMAVATVICAIVLGSIFAYWTWYPYKPLTIHKAVILGSKQVPQGGILPLHLTYTKPKAMPGVGIRSFVDGISYTTPPQPGNLPAGYRLTALRPISIPKTLPPGVYHLHNSVAFKVNPIRTITIRYETTTFTVTPK